MSATITTLHSAPEPAPEPAPAPAPTVEADPDFAAFWQAYPRKTKKGDARKAWGQTAGVRPALADVLKAIEWQRRGRDWREDGGKYIPYPATWLRAEQWDDEPPEVAEVAEAPRELRPGIDCCRWSGCGHTGSMLRHAGWLYCDQHVEALKRGETPVHKRK